MPNKHATGSRSTVIRCPNCGEDYSVTYKRCPFCDEKTAAPRKQPADYDDDYDDREEAEERPARSSAKHPSGGSAHRGGGGGSWSPPRIALTVASVAIIIAAIWIVVTQIMPLVNRGNTVGKDPQPTPPAVTQGPSQTAAPDNSAAPEGTGSPGIIIPGATTPPSDTLTPETTPKPTIPAGQTATGFTLSKSEFTMSDKYGEPVTLKVTFTPAGSTGAITWTSSDPEVAAVDANGKVTRGNKSGRTTITATLAGGFKQECTVLGNYTTTVNTQPSGGGDNTGTTSANTGSLSLNRTDFTLQKAGETFTMKVSGTSSAPIWSVGNSSVATISSDGKVTAVSKGKTTITCTVDGKTLECIVRCDF